MEVAVLLGTDANQPRSKNKRPKLDRCDTSSESKCGLWTTYLCQLGDSRWNLDCINESEIVIRCDLYWPSLDPTGGLCQSSLSQTKEDGERETGHPEATVHLGPNETGRVFRTRSSSQARLRKRRRSPL